MALRALPHGVETLLVAIGLIVLLFGLHRLAVFAEARGWTFYRIRPPRVRTLGLFEELIDPEVEHLVEEQRAEEIRADQVDSGQGTETP
jgi:hypothetical protein